MVAVDAVCARIMGIAPESVKHLYLAAKAKIGKLDRNEIEIVGLQLDEAKDAFSSAAKAAQSTQH